jgi:hypothetical protein
MASLINARLPAYAPHSDLQDNKIAKIADGAFASQGKIPYLYVFTLVLSALLLCRYWALPWFRVRYIRRTCDGRTNDTMYFAL